MKQACIKCKKHKRGPLKVYSFRKKIGKKSKNVVEYYCTDCFVAKDLERSKNVRREEERAIKRKAIARMRRRPGKVR